MRITLPKDLQGKALIKYLVDNKKELIKQKTSMPIKSDDFGFTTDVLSFKKKTSTSKAADTQTVQEIEPGEVNVKVICNTALWCDSQMDVLLPDCWKKTIDENGPQKADKIYHLRDHKQTTEGIIGYPQKIYSDEFLLSALGLSKFGMGSTQCLIMESLVKESLDEKCFQLYLDRKIKQHSIGLQYIKLDLCVGDKEYASAVEYENWVKYYPMVINKDVIDKAGYFWIVTEIRLYENSAVLFGSNEITPDITDENKEEPLEDTQENKSEPESTTPKKSITEMLNDLGPIIKNFNQN